MIRSILPTFPRSLHVALIACIVCAIGYGLVRPSEASAQTPTATDHHDCAQLRARVTTLTAEVARLESKSNVR